MKYQINLSDDQENLLVQLMPLLKANSKADVIRKALGLAALVLEARNEDKKLALVDEYGQVQVLRFI